MRTLDGLGKTSASLIALVLGRIAAQIDCGRLTVLLPSGDRIAHSGPRSWAQWSARGGSEAIIWLLSDASYYVSGAIIDMAGGRYCRAGD